MNRSTYYKFINHQESNRAKENAYIRSCILTLYAKYKKRLGVAKMSTVKPFIHKSKSVSDEPCKNILKQEFNQSEPNIVWVCDFTYIRAGGRFYYLCAILDLFSRKVIAYKLSNKSDTQLAIDTVNLAVAGRGTSEGIVFHTDRGCQFTAKKFRKHLDNLNMVQSFSAKGLPYDNAVMECFFNI